MDKSDQILSILERQQDILIKQQDMLTKQQSTLDNHQVMFEKIHATLDKLQTDVSVLKTDVADLKTDVSVLKTDVADLKTGLANLSTKVDDNHRMLLDTVRGHKQEMHDKFNELKADMNGRFKRLEVSVLEIDRPEGGHRMDLKQQERRIHCLERDLIQAFDRIDELEKHIHR